jgi:hypothetical protein
MMMLHQLPLHQLLLIIPKLLLPQQLKTPIQQMLLWRRALLQGKQAPEQKK